MVVAVVVVVVVWAVLCGNAGEEDEGCAQTRNGEPQPHPKRAPRRLGKLLLLLVPKR